MNIMKISQIICLCGVFVFMEVFSFESMALEEVQKPKYVPCKESEANCWSCGDTCSARFDSESATMVISGMGNMLNEKQGNQQWKSVLSSIKHVVVESGITSVGNYAFNGASHMETAVLKDVTEIGVHSFSASGLKEIDLPDSLTHIGSSALAGTKLKELVIPKNVTLVDSYAFGHNGLLETVTILGDKTIFNDQKSAASIYKIFSRDEKLKTVYCLAGEQADRCLNVLEFADLPASCLKTFMQNGSDYWIDGKKYDNITNMLMGKNTPIRIYSIQDAVWLVKQNKDAPHTFKIRYQ